MSTAAASRHAAKPRASAASAPAPAPPTRSRRRSPASSSVRVEVARAAVVPARLPKGMEPGLFETGTFDGGERTYPNGCHIAEVEIDEATGTVELTRYAAIEDVGHMVNPLLVEGQLHGG